MGPKCWETPLMTDWLQLQRNCLNCHGDSIPNKWPLPLFLAVIQFDVKGRFVSMLSFNETIINNNQIDVQLATDGKVIHAVRSWLRSPPIVSEIDRLECRRGLVEWYEKNCLKDTKGN